MKVYISGPITSKDKEQQARNIEAFFSMSEKVAALGHEPINPCEVLSKDGSWLSHMRADIIELVQCEAYVVLPCWRDSRGARIEVELADALGLLRLQV
jgi:hypothetical protein